MDEWQWSEGANDFASDPPNATLSVYEQGNPINTLTVVEISQPILEGNDLNLYLLPDRGHDARGGWANGVVY